jgi:hypothetical protein
VTAGYANTANNDIASVTGGVCNSASGNSASASGGYSNFASWSYASVSGGAGCNSAYTEQFLWFVGTLAGGCSSTLHN